MATRELSSSLMNLKFMQRAIPREQMVKKQEQEDVRIDAGAGSFGFTSAVATKPSFCAVIIEGDPKHAAIRGRMSFKGFNPLIEKLNDDDQRKLHPETQTTNNLSKTNYSSPYKGLSFNNRNQAPANPNGYHKRKQSEEVCDTQYPNKWHKTNLGYRQTSLSKGRYSFTSRNHAPENPNGFHKRKQFEEACATRYPNSRHKTNQSSQHPSPDTNRFSFKQPADRKPFLGIREFNQKRLIITR